MEKEKPLLGERGGSGGGSSSTSRRRSVRRRDQPPKFTRRSDAITYGSSYQKAAALVDLAEDGVGIPEQILDQENFEHAAKYYFFYIKFDFIWTLNYFAMLALNFLEGYKDLTGTWWSLTYFISYYLITVLLLLNLVVAFVLEAFFAELDIEKSENGEGENKDVTGVKSGRRTVIGRLLILVVAKTRSERVDLLLHHMLSAELGETEQQSSDA